MEQDYILIAVDRRTRVSIRFAALNLLVTRSVRMKQPTPSIQTIYAPFLVNSVLLGSRYDQQITTLFKLQLGTGELTINCEVSPRGSVRSAIFSTTPSPPPDLPAGGSLHTVRLHDDQQQSTSVISLPSHDITAGFRDYLERSVPAPALLLTQAHYGLWIEKLPDTTEAQWQEWITPFRDGQRFTTAVTQSDDPDLMMQTLFAQDFRILAVTHPELTCSCSKEKILDALRSLPEDDMVALFMESNGLTSQCEYCQTEWKVSDAELRALLRGSAQVH